jgi:putative PIN family toxin of toxin-antitoxin system
LKVVVDANLFASGLIKPNSNPDKILYLIKENQVELILSPPIISGLGGRPSVSK